MQRSCKQRQQRWLDGISRALSSSFSPLLNEKDTRLLPSILNNTTIMPGKICGLCEGNTLIVWNKKESEIQRQRESRQD
jgi:hypothetical protein